MNLRVESMCHNIKIDNQTKNGIVVTCTDCKKYQVLFKNLNFNFTKNEYDSFISYLNGIDGKEWEEEYKNSIYDKKIPIPTAQHNLLILLNSKELFELKKLLLIHCTEIISLLRHTDINYKMIFN